MATARHHPAPAFLTFTGKQETVNPYGFGIAPRLPRRSMWQYSRRRPKKWHGHIFVLSLVAKNSLNISKHGRSRPMVSIPIILTPWSRRYSTALGTSPTYL